MNLHEKQLIGLPVRTKSGDSLGKVYDFIFDSETGVAIKYLVRDILMVKNILGNGLVIDKDQVIEINEKEMIVEDMVVKSESPYSNLAQA
ncbi:MAG: PRC-barrel domain-containing protein [Patescibacteria group bacterium]|jgi:sporulation protein YlmC with PRC-barrel domain